MDALKRQMAGERTEGQRALKCGRWATRRMGSTEGRGRMGERAVSTDSDVVERGVHEAGHGVSGPGEK